MGSAQQIGCAGSSVTATRARHILVAAARKSSGKTSLSIGLCRALVRRGLVVQPFKKGPDYIDPLWLEKASRRACFNLDFNTMAGAEIAGTFARRSGDADFALIETNKGLFDGLDVEGSDSNAALASLLGSPIVLVVDTVGMTRGIAPLLHGYTTFDPDISIAGVILNKTGGPRHEGKLRAAIERYTDLEVLGAIGRNDSLVMAERHLGLTTPEDAGGGGGLIDRLADAVEQGVDLDAVLGIAAKTAQPPEAIGKQPAGGKPVTIGIARDEAFGFYYADDLEALENAGARLVFFNALTAPRLPDVDGLFIGGGFPETHLRALEANSGLRADIRTAIEGGMPAYAECGGLMYLCRKIDWHGKSGEMAGVVPGDAVMRSKPQGRGFARLKTTAQYPWSGPVASEYNVHEFHYAGIENLPGGMSYAYEVTRGHGIDGAHDGIVINNLLAGFCHFRHTGANPWADRFVEFVRKCKSSK